MGVSSPPVVPSASIPIMLVMRLFRLTCPTFHIFFNNEKKPRSAIQRRVIYLKVSIRYYRPEGSHPLEGDGEFSPEGAMTSEAVHPLEGRKSVWRVEWG